MSDNNAAGSGARTLTILSAGAVKFVVTDLARAFDREHACRLEFTFGTIGEVKKHLAAGRTADVVHGTTPAIGELERAGAVVAGSRRELGRTATGLCVKAGAPKPDISTPDKLQQALLAARSFAYTNPANGGTSGIFLVGLLGRLGIADVIARKAVLCANGDDVVEKVASGVAELGSTFISEIVLAEGADVVGPLPAEIGNTTSYSAGLLSVGRNRELASAWIGTLLAPANRRAWARGGFEAAGA
jgi:molybdate transport system substrate-binding protein